MEQQSNPLFDFTPTTTVAADYSKVAKAKGDIADAQAKSQSEPQPFDFLGIAQGVTQITGQMAAEKNMVDSHTAKLKALDFMSQNQNLTGHELEQKIKTEIQSISEGDYSEGYKEGTFAILDLGYKQALEAKEEERVNGFLNVVSNKYGVLLDSNRNKGMNLPNPELYAANMAQQYNLPVEQVRNAMVATTYKDSITFVNAAKNNKQLEEIVAGITEKNKNLKTPMFLDSKSKKFAPVVASYKTALASAIKTKKKEFKEDAKSRIAAATGNVTDVNNSYILDPNLPETQSFFRDAYDDDLSRLNAYNKYVKGYNNAKEARDFLINHPLGDARPVAPDNSMLKKELTKRATVGFTNSFASGSFETAIDIINNEEDVMTDVGDNLMRQINSLDDNKALTQTYNNLSAFMDYPGGSNAVKKMLGDEYKNVIATNEIATMLTNGDYVKARNIVAEAEGTVSNAAYKPEINNKMYELANELGTMRDEYLETVRVVGSVNASLVNKKFLKNLRDKFNDNVKQFTTEEDEGTKFNIMYAKVPDALDQDAFNNSIFAAGKNLNSGISGTEIKFLPNNKVIMHDEYGVPQIVFNTKPMLEMQDEAYTLGKIQEKRDAAMSDGVNIDSAIETGVSVTADGINQVMRFTNTVNAFKFGGVLDVIRKFDEWFGSDDDLEWTQP